MVSLCLASALLGATTPLCYELAAELTYPAPEGISAGILSFLNNVGGLLLLLVMPNVPLSYSNCLMTGSVLLSVLCVGCATERYTRTEADMDARAALDPESNLNGVSYVRNHNFPYGRVSIYK